jgi:hypothetical protein
MDRIFGIGIAGLALFVLSTAGLAAEAGKAEPSTLPLELRLVAKKTTYPLDLGGKTAEEFRKQLKEAEKSGRFPPPPAVDLVVELHNRSAKDVHVKFGSDDSLLLLDLAGPGAVSVEAQKAFTQEFRAGRRFTIAPGKTESIKIASLRYGYRGEAKQAYWTQAGDYKLTASYRLPMAPAPQGAEDAGEGFGIVTLTSAPVKIKVEAK